MVDSRARALVVLRGSRPETAAAAMDWLGDTVDPLWVGARDGTEGPACPRAELARQLGGSHPAVVLDLHDGFDGDSLGRAHGLVPGGGVLVLRLPAEALPGRMGRWVETHLQRAPRTVGGPPWRAAPVPTSGTPGQLQLVQTLSERLAQGSATVTVVRADRGRGKSSGVGMALARVDPGKNVVVVGPHRRATEEVLRFARRPSLTPTDPLDLLGQLEAGLSPHGIVVDEAARVPVPLLQALCRAAPHSHLVFATTTHGYEGCGRGFSHRFLPWLQQEARPVFDHPLTEPIRWGPADPLERWVFDVLALDAGPAQLRGGPTPPRVVCIHRDRLVEEPRLLREVFGLLVAAHYRTTPADLQHLLDDPGVALHAVLRGDRVVAAGWLVSDGGLDPDTIRAVQRGRRLRGSALAETLICHAGHPGAARLRMWRSVRTAVHPSLRGQGLARLLIEHEHEAHGDADLIGTLFGATQALVGMRMRLGYQVVRVGCARSARSGVPSVLMVRPVSDAAQALVARMRAELARDLPALLRRLQAERGVPLPSALTELLTVGLPAPAGWSTPDLRTAMQRYVEGATPIDALAAAPRLWLMGRADWERGLSALERAAIHARVLADDPWHVVADKSGAHSIPVAQRAVRRGLVKVWHQHDCR